VVVPPDVTCSSMSMQQCVSAAFRTASSLSGSCWEGGCQHMLSGYTTMASACGTLLRPLGTSAQHCCWMSAVLPVMQPCVQAPVCHVCQSWYPAGCCAAGGLAGLQHLKQLQLVAWWQGKLLAADWTASSSTFSGSSSSSGGGMFVCRALCIHVLSSCSHGSCSSVTHSMWVEMLLCVGSSK
jgi:hypothetical protein